MTISSQQPAALTNTDADLIIEMGRSVLDIESRAVAALKDRINGDFVHACEYMLSCQGRIVVIGMGKSGPIGGKIAATLASTGSAAFFVHPGEASHGDLGMITTRDVVLAISNSGETDEILTILPIIKRQGVPLIAMTGKAGSTLGRNADVHLDIGVEEEACPLGLAPTASTTATLAMGDALAVALLERRGFSAEDFALSHPGGALGRRLLLMIEDIMQKDEHVPTVSAEVSIAEALVEMTNKRLGFTTIVDADDKLLGMFTDGDLRRLLDRKLDLQHTPIGEVMTHYPKSIDHQALAVEAVKIMEEYKVNGLAVVDEQQRVVGALNMHDLFKAGVV